MNESPYVNIVSLLKFSFHDHVFFCSRLAGVFTWGDGVRRRGQVDSPNLPSRDGRRNWHRT